MSWGMQIAGDTLFNTSTAPVFRAFKAQHSITLIVIVTLCLLIALAARIGTTSCRKWLGRGIAFLLMGYAAFLYLQQGITRALNWQNSLPLELCNLVMIACVMSLFKPNRLTSEIAYFGGLSGTLLAVVTPDLTQGFPSWAFILFFWGHGATLLAIVFLVAGQSFRPSRGSILRMFVALNVYGLVIGPIDAVTGWNYGYLCRKPSAPSLFDYFGPWPWYLLSIEVIALLSFFLLDLPWRLLARSRQGASGL